MTIDFKRLRELEQKATKVPWAHFYFRPDCPGSMSLRLPCIASAVGNAEASPHILLTDACDDDDADAEFLAALRNAAPALLDLAERAERMAHEKTADGIPMYLGDTVYVVRSLGGFDDCGVYGGADPLGSDAIVEAEVAWLGTLGSDRQRVGFIQQYASMTFTAMRQAVFSTEDAARAALAPPANTGDKP